MDQGLIGSIFTVIVFISFVGIVLWAFSSRNKKSFDEAANLVFADEQQDNATKDKKQESENL
jgi:cytochrome c oxidase cbb3-type subunit 4